MLKPKTLTQILNQANTGGISATLLFNKDGRLLAYSGYNDTDVRMIAAIASGIWTSYCNYGRMHLGSSQLSNIYIEAEHGVALITAVADALLCLYSRENPSTSKINIGTMKLKIKALADHLRMPLSQLSGI